MVSSSAIYTPLQMSNSHPNLAASKGEVSLKVDDVASKNYSHNWFFYSLITTLIINVMYYVTINDKSTLTLDFQCLCYYCYYLLIEAIANN